MHMHGLRAKPPEQNNHRPPRIYLAARRAELRLPTVLAVALISIRCVSRAYAKFVLCLPLPLPFAPPRGAFLERFLGGGPENRVSGAYARHMVYIREAGDGEDERERGGGSGRYLMIRIPELRFFRDRWQGTGGCSCQCVGNKLSRQK